MAIQNEDCFMVVGDDINDGRTTIVDGGLTQDPASDSAQRHLRWLAWLHAQTEANVRYYRFGDYKAAGGRFAEADNAAV